MPGDLLEDIALVDFHGVGDLGPGGLGAGRVQNLDNPFCDGHLPRGLDGGQGTVQVVISTVALAAQIIQLPAGHLDRRLTP